MRQKSSRVCPHGCWLFCRVVCSLFLHLQRLLESNDRTANIVFLGQNLMFLFLVSEKGTEKADLGAAAPKYPAASRANADAPRRLIRTRLPDSRNFAFAASKRTAKTEKLTRIGIEALAGLFGENSPRFKPRCARIRYYLERLPSFVGCGARTVPLTVFMGQGPHIGV